MTEINNDDWNIVEKKRIGNISYMREGRLEYNRK